jgi:hypothetical protein
MQYVTYDYYLGNMWWETDISFDDFYKFWDVWLLSDDVCYGLYLYTYAIQDQMANLLLTRTKMIGLKREVFPCGTWMTFDPVNDPDGIVCNAFSAGQSWADVLPTPITLSSTSLVSLLRIYKCK